MFKNHWVKEVKQLEPCADMAAWLTKPYILSQALKRNCNNFNVKVLEQGYKQPFPEECDILNLKHKTPLPLIRQVVLQDGTRPLTCGRVVIPFLSAKHLPGLGQLGTNLIGESLLYHNPDIVRGTFEYAHLAVTSPLVSELIARFSTTILENKLWARRSVFYVKSAPLLVTDLFLPDLGPYVT
ncbi:MAG: chorismate lyase [Proteobacteria bacterium]|nr:chorismate lyase [Pseudomonadota bacterium]